MDKLVRRSAALPPDHCRLAGPGFSLPANTPSLSDHIAIWRQAFVSTYRGWRATEDDASIIAWKLVTRGGGEFLLITPPVRAFLTAFHRVPTMRPMDKTCSRCDIVFHCSSPDSVCWCNDVTLDQVRWREEKKQFQNCLSPACLNLFAISPRR